MKSMLLKYWLIGPFLLLTIGITAWSWVLVDPSFTLVNHADWTKFRSFAISIGYFQRQYSANIYVFLIIALTISSLLIVKWYKGPVLPPLVLIGIIAGLLSYPALSHDLFNYIFDARIVTHYHANPYIHKALDFPADHMLRFMHWVHRTYPYGPTYLLISLIPSALGLGIFSLTFFLFKGMHVMLFVIAGWLLSKLSKTAALIFITSPLIIVEGLINSHNDFIALSLAIIGIYFLQKRNNVFSLLFLATSGLVKFISLPIMVLPIKEFISKYNKTSSDTRNTYSSLLCHPELVSGSRLFRSVQTWHIALAGILILLAYLISRQEIQPWYFLNLFIFLPFAPGLFEKFTIASTGLLLSYYPYVFGGEWGQGGDVGVKRSIITYSVLLNISFLLMYAVYKRLKLRRA